MSEIKISETLGMVIHFIKEGDLTDEDKESLWQQGVNMDDWDYILLCPPDVVEEVKEIDDWEQKEITVLKSRDWTLERMLTGCCSNRWYRAKLRSKECALGIAYHA